MSEKEIFNSFVAVLGTIFTFILGSWDVSLIVLVVFMALDYTTGVMGAIVQKNVSSHTGFVGILRKATILIVLIVAVLLDRLLNGGTWVFRTLVCYFYIGNEAISLLENVAKIGVPVPVKLIQILEQLKKKEAK
jgi:toxin secretion/phage lysis holin